MPATYADWYQRVRPELSQGGLWLRGGELNSLPASEYERRRLRVLWVRLSTYVDTAESYTHQLLYQIAAGTPGVFPDLAYLPPRPDAVRFDRDRVPWLLGTQTKLGPAGFDVVGFSNSTVQELVNLPTLLGRSVVPLSKSARIERADVPLLILGGANALFSAAVCGGDPLVDAVFVGEDAAAIRELLCICRDGKLAGLTKRQVLARLVDCVPGLIEPDRPRAKRRASVSDLARAEAFEAGPVLFTEARLGCGQVQISEGCACLCGFCAEGWERRPYREVAPERVLDLAQRIKASMGLDTVELSSFNFNMHSGLYQILWGLLPLFRQIGLKSQRFDFLAHQPEMAEILQALGKGTITCGLEGISSRLRRYLHKNLPDGVLESSLAAIFRVRPRELKVSLLATGREEEADFVEFSRLLEAVSTIRLRARAQTRVVFSMTPMVRFPLTPMGFECGPPIAAVEACLGEAARRVRASGFEFRAAASLAEYRVSQILCRAAGGAGLTRALVTAVSRTGFVYYRDVAPGFAAELDRALREEGLDAESLFRGAPRTGDAGSVAATVSTGVDHEVLRQAHQRALAGDEAEYCLGRSWARAACIRCGACSGPAQVRALLQARQAKVCSAAHIRARIKTLRELEVTAEFLVDVGPSALGLPRQAFGVALARALMLTDGRLVAGYRGWGVNAEDADEAWRWVSGVGCLRLSWLADTVPRVRELVMVDTLRRQVNERLGGWGELLGTGSPDRQSQVLRIESPYEFSATTYLRARGLRYTLIRAGDASYCCRLTQDSTRKGVVRALRYRGNSAGPWRVEVTPGRKFRLSDFVAETFALPGPGYICRLSLRAVSGGAEEAGAAPELHLGGSDAQSG